MDENDGYVNNTRSIHFLVIVLDLPPMAVPAIGSYTIRLLADVESYPESYFEILAQKGKKLFFHQK